MAAYTVWVHGFSEMTVEGRDIVANEHHTFINDADGNAVLAVANERLVAIVREDVLKTAS